MRIASLSNFSQLGVLVTSYTVTPSSTAVNEGDTITFTIATFGVANGSTLYWTTTGTVSSADFSDGVTTGSVITTGNSTTFTRTITQDSSFESAETFAIEIHLQSTTGELVATSSTITISDRRYTLVPSSSAVTEGTTLSFSVSTVNVANGTLYWSINHITTSNADFSAVTGSFTVTSSAGTFDITTIADLSTESGETFTVSVRVGSTSGTIVATCSTITITDTSTTPTSQAFYGVAGTYTWTAPTGVTTVSVLCIGAGGTGGTSYGGGGGGGALAYGNNITVVPGTNYTVVVGAGQSGAGGASYFSSTTVLRALGGSAGNSGVSNSSGGGGGAAGYSGNGGNGQGSNSATTYAGGAGGTANGTAMTAGFTGGTGGRGGNTVTTAAATTAPTGGAGSGGKMGNGISGQGGGGVGVLGEGSSGAATPAITTGGSNSLPMTVNGGSGGTNGTSGTGGTFGGGGTAGGFGTGGAVRIIWPGNVRLFPSTRIDDEPGPAGSPKIHPITLC